MLILAETTATETTATTTETTENFFVQQWHKVVEYFTNNAWGVLAFFITLVVGLIVIKIIMMITKRAMRARNVDELVVRFLTAILRFTLLLVLILILMAMLGISIGGITTALSAAVLAIGMALKEFLSNVASGIVLVGSKKYKQGDFINVASKDGSIVDINFLFTTLKTPDGKQVTIPNSTMTGNAVTNFGAYPKRRVDLTLSVAYESDCELVTKTVVDVMKSNGKIYLDPEPNCRLKTFSASSLDFFATCWCDNEDYWDVYYYLTGNIYNEFKKNNISIPFMQIEMRERTDEVKMPIIERPLPVRVEKNRVNNKRKTYQDYEDMSIKELADDMDERRAKRKAEREAKKAEKEKEAAAKKALKEAKKEGKNGEKK